MSSAKKSVIDVVIPVYNNEDSIVELFDRLIFVRKNLKVEGIDVKFIFVEDGSLDGSYQILETLCRNHGESTLVRHSRNFGARQALKKGIQYSTGDATVLLAADLQEPPELILDLVRSWASGYKFVLAKRVTRIDPITGKIFAQLFNFILRKFIIKDFPNGGFDSALFDSQLRPYLINSSKTSFAPILLVWLGFKPKVIEVNRTARKHGKSGWTFSRKLDLFLDILLDYSPKLMRYVMLTGLITAFFSAIFVLITVVQRINGNVTLAGYTTLLSLMVFFFSTSIALISLCGEYLIRLLAENNRRPESVVDEVTSY
jgi:glycosyltransferase involved in cell wall biosynthesis